LANGHYDFYFTYKELKQDLLDLDKYPKSNFYFTYKELKLFQNWDIIEKIPDFYFTYKELKLTILSTKYLPIPDFYFTYKELKPWTCPSKNQNRSIFTLPIRNWNIS